MSKVLSQRVQGTKTMSEMQAEAQHILQGDLEKARHDAAFNVRMEGFRQVYEKSARIISDTDVNVMIVMDPGGMNYPGWTDGKNIWINGKMIVEEVPNDMASWVRHTKSINLHELCHVLYTPRKNSHWIKWLMEWPRYGHADVDYKLMPYLKHAWNILEDQRVETMFVAKYRPAGAYFESMVLQWLLNDDEKLDNAHILLHGRRYLPTKMQTMVREHYVAKHGNEKAERAQGIIDQYLHIVHPRDNQKAQKLVLEFTQLIVEMVENGEQMPEAVAGQNDDILEGDQPKEAAQKEAQRGIENIEPREMNDDDTEEGEGHGADGELDEEDGEGDAEGDAGGAGAEDADAAGEGSDGGREQEASSEPERAEGELKEGKQAGAGADPEGFQKAKEQLQAQMEDLMEDERFQADVERVGKAIQDVINEAQVLAEGEDMGADLVQVAPSVLATQRKLEKHLRDIKVQLEEQHFRNQTHGQLDPGGFLTRQPWEVNFFRSYDPGALDEVEVEAVILVDQSTSMASKMGSVSSSLWAMKRALELIDARVTVLGFSSHCWLLYGPNDMVHKSRMKNFGVKGGTHPQQALTEAYKVLQASDRKVKLLLTLTDGEWFKSDKSDQLVRAINEMGAVTQLQFMGGKHFSTAMIERYRHNHQSVVGVNDAGDLAKAAVEIVKKAMVDRVHEDA